MSKVQWIDPKEQLPEQKQEVLFKTIVLHTKKIRHGRFRDDDFEGVEITTGSFHKTDVWGWIAFEDSDTRK